ncbi:helix-turn-helix-type transcriptional regulator [Vibrio zhanjiangensis]|uniref:Helix-turn-helix-type transcriptional regulator n=1 Tax=Vibrio zhanjiangensis TaxID=1046128 RepID=A0ABQ6EZL8_9VIBR|nr:MerR family transcriptional regulator [Vibrio zhanjiangensis]GLT18015.1 helix-turn-helix-type transcriptional regulator [Vibrio zhanjiangensis]
MKKYAIREISEITGVKPVTLRAWQRRYSLIEPERTSKGHRLYTQEHIDLIDKIQAWLNKGVSIGKVKALMESGNSDGFQVEGRVHQLDDVELVLDALAKLNKGKAETIINGVIKEYPLKVVDKQFIQPIQQALSSVRPSLRSLQHGLFHSLMLSKLNSIIDAENKASRTGRALFVSTSGNTDIGSRLLALSLVEQGLNVTMLDEVEDLSGLVVHPAIDDFSMIGIYSATAISESQLMVLDQLEATFSGQLVVSELLQQLRGE